MRPLSRKYQSIAELQGCIRLILTANRDDLLGTKGSVTPDDLKAIAQRFMYIYSGDDAAEFLLELDSDTRDLWRREGIPAHVRWLADNRHVEIAGRFWVEGSLSVMPDLMITSTDWNSRVCNLLVSYLMRPNPVDNTAQGLIRRKGGELWVNTQGVVDAWPLVFKDTKVEPEVRLISQALGSITVKKIRQRWGTASYHYAVIDMRYLDAWSLRNGVGDPETMANVLTEDSPGPQSGTVRRLPGLKA